MTRAKITSKGQVTLPKRIRDNFGLRPGDEIDFVLDGPVLRVEKVITDNPFARWRGYLKHLEGVDVDKMLDDWRGR